MTAVIQDPGTRKAAGIWRLVMAVRNRCHRKRRPAQPVMDDTDWLRHVKVAVVPDPGPQILAEAAAFHAGPATLALDETGWPGWEWHDIENPDLAETWKTYADFPLLAHYPN